MKSTITVLVLLFFTMTVYCQCEPETKMTTSTSLEFAHDMGFIFQVGFTSQQSPFSVHVGIRARMHEDTVGKQPYNVAQVLPRLELSYRAGNFLYLCAGLAKAPDISILGYKPISDKAAVFGRCLYDGNFFASAGVKILFYK